MKKQNKQSVSQNTAAAEAPVVQTPAPEAQAVPAVPIREFAEQVRADGPYSLRNNDLPGWKIAMTTAAGKAVSTVYRVVGGEKARNLALAMCRQHRIPLTFGQIAA